MSRTLFISTFAVALPLALVAISLLHPARARSDEKTLPTEVRVDNFSFGPEALTVPANSTVAWVNKDDVPHVIASNDGLFKSKALDTDDKFSFTFTNAGDYKYFCSLHPHMTGMIKVE